MRIVTFISIYTLENVSNNFMMQKTKIRFKRFRSQQTNKLKKIHFDSIHTITTSIRRLYLYESYIRDLFKSRYKTLMSRNENIKSKEKIMSE